MSANSDNTKKEKLIKFLYIRDPRDGRHVLTVARSLNEKKTKLKVGWSINRLPKKIFYVDDIHGIPAEVESGDYFRKDRGRQIAAGRLENCPLTVKLEGKTDRPIVMAVWALASEENDPTVPRAVRKLAQEWLADFAKDDSPFAQRAKENKNIFPAREI